MVMLVSPNKLTHLHVATESRDCDGLYERDFVTVPRDGETGRELFAWWVGHALERTWHYEVELTRGTRTDGLPYYEYRAYTEEGWAREEVYACASPRCNRARTRYRDHTAEAAGY